MKVDEFEDAGFFWLPEDVDAQHRVPGTLRVSKLGTVTLETFGLADSSAHSLAYLGQRESESRDGRILGVTKAHGNVTLERTRMIGRNLNMMALGSSFTSATTRASWLFIGRHYEPDGPIEMSGISFMVEGLDKWLSRSGISAQFHYDQRRAIIEFQAPADLSYVVDSETTAGIHTSYSLPSANRETTEVNLSQRAYVKLTTESWWSLKDVADYLTWFRDLLCLATDRNVSVTSIEGFSREFTDPGDSSDSREVPITIIYEATNQRDWEPDLFGPMMLFQFEGVSRDFEETLKRWCRMNSLHPAPFRLLFEAFGLERETPLSWQFQRLVEAIETLDKATGRRAVRLDRRIQRMVDPFAHLVGLTESSGEFAQRVSTTRHFLVHHDEGKRADAAHGANLFRLTVQCELLLMYHLVSVVTGDHTDAIELIRESQPVLRRLEAIGNA